MINNEDTPYGIMSLDNVVTKNGYNSGIYNFDQIICGLVNDETMNFECNLVNVISFIVNKLKRNRTKIISFYTMCSNFYSTIEVVKALKKENKYVKVVMAGPHSALLAKEIISNCDYVDFVALGEGEQTIIPFIEAVVKDNYSYIDGFAYRTNGEIVINWDRTKRLKEDELPRFDLGNYIDLNSKSTVTLEGGRGCPYKCTFCSTQFFWGNIFTIKPANELINEILFYINKYGIRRFSITHDLFTANKKYIIDFCSKIIDRGIKIEWGCSSRLDCLDKEVIAFLSKAGCKKVYIGIESGSTEIQERINKKLDLERLIPILDLLGLAEIDCTLSFMYGFPYEAKDQLLETLNLIYDTKKREREKEYRNHILIQFNRISFLPGTQLTEQHYDSLVYEGINTMSYNDYNLKIQDDLNNQFKSGKELYINFYNLKSNINKFSKGLGYFICLLFDDIYYVFPDTIDGILSYYDLLRFSKEMYRLDESAYYEITKYHNTYFGDDREGYLIEGFFNYLKEFIESSGKLPNRIYGILEKEYSDYVVRQCGCK